jgi:hypothetical protein
MRAVDEIRLDDTRRERGSSNALTIMISYAGLSITFLVILYLTSMSGGTSPGELESMTAFP